YADARRRCEGLQLCRAPEGLAADLVDAVPVDAGTQRYLLRLPGAQGRADVRDRRRALPRRANAAGQRHARELPHVQAAWITSAWRHRTWRWRTGRQRIRSSLRLNQMMPETIGIWGR